MALEFALIGYGAIARYVLKNLRRDEPARCTALIVRKARVAEAQKALGDSVNVVTSVPELGFHVPPLVVEAAGHGGLVEHGPAALEAFIDNRDQMTQMLDALAPEGWQRIARHAIFGPTTLEELIRFITTHDIVHIRQGVQTLRVVS